MHKRYIMTAFGKDRVGIVSDVTRILFENNCNLEDTSMTMLADEFTLNLLFSSKNESIEAQLLNECRRLEMEKGISAFIRSLQERRDTPSRGYKTCGLHVEGLDQAGIVYRCSQFLAQRGLNILDLKSSSRISPESGSELYLMDIHIQVPEQVSLDRIEEELNAIADELHVDIRMSR